MPTFPRYIVTYNVKYVLYYAKKMFYFRQNITRFNFKILVTMMCLLSKQRSQTLVFLSTDCKYLNNSRRVFYLSKLLKTSHPKSHQQPIELKAYSHDVSLCVVANYCQGGYQIFYIRQVQNI